MTAKPPAIDWVPVRHTPEPQRVRFAMAGLLLLGSLTGLLGALPVVWSMALAFDALEAGWGFLAVAGGGAVAGFGASHWLSRGRSVRTLAAVGAGLAGTGLSMLPLAGSATWFPAPLAAVGCGMGMVGASAAGTLRGALTQRRTRAVLHLAGVAFGFGAIAAVLLVRLLAIVSSWPAAVLAGAAALMGVGWIFARGPELELERAVGAPFESELSAPAGFLLATTLFLQAGNYGVVGGWLALYLTRQFEITTPTSLSILALFWTAVTCGRVVATRLPAVTSRFRSLLLVLALTLLGCLFLLLSVETSGALVGALLLGLALGALHPLTLNAAARRYAAANPRAMAHTLTATFIAGIGLAAAVGPLASAYGIDVVIWLALALGLAAPIVLAVILIETKLSEAAAPAA